MSGLDRVTITGADDSIQPEDLMGLSEKYPWVEWGILVSRSNEGTPRYPTNAWIERLQDLAHRNPVKLSLHLCGAFVRALLMGEATFAPELLSGFQRVQLNFHAENVHCDMPKFRNALGLLGPRQFIFQMDGDRGNAIFQKMVGSNVDCVPLFDMSGGAGILPDEWPGAVYIKRGMTAYHGFAGGLGPNNLVEQLPKIAIAACGSRHWVDMETRVRSDADRKFDLALVEEALRICSGFVDPLDLQAKRA